MASNWFVQLHTARLPRRSVKPTTIAIVLPLTVLLLHGCGSSSQTLVGPSGSKCDISIPGTLPAVGPGGGSGSLSISAARECAWSVTSGAAWISITSDRAGQGPGTVNYTAAPNPTPVTRRGTLNVGERQVELVQQAAACQFTFTPSQLGVEADGGEHGVGITVLEGCAWSAESESSWISIAGPKEGTGPASLDVRIEPNPGGDRAGRLRIAGRPYTVSQERDIPLECDATLGSAAATVPAAGRNLSVTVSVDGACGWTAVSQVPWIQVTRATGAGAGAVELSIGANTGPQRVGIVRIAGELYMVTQHGEAASPSCSYVVDLSQQSVPAAGGGLTASVATAEGCGWTATSQVPWITVTSGAQGTASGNVGLDVAPNNEGQRSGIVTIAGTTFTVTQSAFSSSPACSYSLGSSAQSVPAGGGPLSVSVSAPTGCNWAASAHVAWVTVTGGAPGSGNGVVSLSVSANPGSQRSGQVTIAGGTFTVSQAAAPTPQPQCTYRLSTGDAVVAAAATTVTVGVMTSGDCGWTAASQAGWITVSSGATGSGNGTVSLGIAANTGPERAGTVMIAGRTFRVTQAAAASTPCTYSISPREQSVPSLGGTFSTTVTTQSGCAWSGASNASWIEITEGGTGTGSGTLAYRVGLGTLIFSREGTLTVAGQTLTVSQAGLLITDGR